MIDIKFYTMGCNKISHYQVPITNFKANKQTNTHSLWSWDWKGPFTAFDAFELHRLFTAMPGSSFGVLWEICSFIWRDWTRGVLYLRIYIFLLCLICALFKKIVASNLNLGAIQIMLIIVSSKAYAKLYKIMLLFVIKSI